MVRAILFVMALFGAAQAMIIKRQANGCTCAGEIDETTDIKNCQSILIVTGTVYTTTDVSDAVTQAQSGGAR
jgi:hypothetical protein